MGVVEAEPRRRVYFCACDDVKQKHRMGRPCEPDFTWYEPQDIEKGKRLAHEQGLPDGTWVPYKVCDACRWMGC